MITTMPTPTTQTVPPMIPVPPAAPRPHNCTELPAPARSQWYEAYYCTECEELNADSGGPIYECVNCGTEFNRAGSADGYSHRCPDCNKFSSKIADHSCYECDQAEADEMWVYDCPVCERLVLAPDQEADCV